MLERAILKRGRMLVCVMIPVLIIGVSMVMILQTEKSYAGEKKMTCYNEILVSGNYAYCNDFGIYKVNLKNGKVKTLRTENQCFDYEIWGMKKKGNYLYFLETDYSDYPDNPTYLSRVNVKNKKYDFLDSFINEYAIKGNKIYYYDELLEKYYVTNLNGKNKRTTNNYPNMKTKRTNKKGYRLSHIWDGKKYTRMY